MDETGISRDPVRKCHAVEFTEQFPVVRWLVDDHDSCPRLDSEFLRQRRSRITGHREVLYRIVDQLHVWLLQCEWPANYLREIISVRVPRCSRSPYRFFFRRAAIERTQSPARLKWTRLTSVHEWLDGWRNFSRRKGIVCTRDK